MKVMLLFPKWTGEYGFLSHFAKKASTWPPLNLAYLAAVAEKKGFLVRIIDGEAESVTVQEMTGRVSEFGPDVIGITATTPFYHKAIELAEALKRNDGKVPIAIGGPHITILKEKAFRNCFDYAFIGEAEESWSKFLDNLEEGKDFLGVKGILYRHNGEIRYTGDGRSTENIDTIPYPARHLLNVDKYNTGTLHGRKRFTTIMSTRGCPFKCAFCSTKVFGTGIRYRDPEAVLEEMKSVIKAFGIKHFIFLDDTLTLNRKHILAICLLIEKEKLGITFEGSTRADLVDEELISTMVKSGFIRTSFGLETVDLKIREIIRKEVPLEAYPRANRITNKYGVETWNSIMLGLPGETRETVGKTLNFLKNNRDIQQANFSIAMPYPGTELYDMAKNGEHGLKLLSEDFSKFRRYGSAVMSVNDLTPQDLLELQNEGFVRIYSAYWRIIPMMKKHGILGVILTFSRVFNMIAYRIRRKMRKK